MIGRRSVRRWMIAGSVAVLAGAGTLRLAAQELSCDVTIDVEKIPSAQRDNLRGFEEQVEQYLNGFRWTNEDFGDEKIHCAITVNFQSATADNRYSAQVFGLTAGQRHDSTQARALLEGLGFAQVIADRGYAAADFLDYLEERGITAVIPPHQRAKVVREYDQHLYKERHLVECFMNKIKHFRRIFSRFEKLDRTYLGFLHFVSVLIWLR